MTSGTPGSLIEAKGLYWDAQRRLVTQDGSLLHSIALPGGRMAYLLLPADLDTEDIDLLQAYLALFQRAMCGPRRELALPGLEEE